MVTSTFAEWPFVPNELKETGEAGIKTLFINLKNVST
jgi:hypothetical protein